jgi:hypothetical protein
MKEGRKQNEKRSKRKVRNRKEKSTKEKLKGKNKFLPVLN